MTDINPIRDLIVRANGLINVDDVYTLYYDETNNIRRLHVTAEGFNVGEPMVFALGGVAHLGPPRPLDIASLKSAVRLQASAKELKLEHLAKGDFLRVLGSPKVATYLDWLWSERLLIHYQALDPLYWSTVDIIDSIITDGPMSHMRAYHALLKNDLYTVMRSDRPAIAEFYFRYQFPNVGPERRVAFASELREWAEMRQSALLDFNFQMLKGVLDAGVRGASLPYLEDEPPNTLIDSFSLFFVERFSLFKNATHILDVEKVIQKRLAETPLFDGERPLQNYRFADSKAEPGVQASDPLIGLLGKFLTYLTRTETADLLQDRRALGPVQRANLSRLNALMDRAHAQSQGFIHHVLALSDMQRASYFLERA